MSGYMKASCGQFVDFSSCQRCGKKDCAGTTMSMFNEQIICMACKEKEKRHPKYEEAHEAECAACRRGDYNFPGIGKPDDL